MKLFWRKFTHIFCKLDRFIISYNNFLSAVKRSSLQTRVSQLTPKKFYEIDSWFITLDCLAISLNITIVYNDVQIRRVFTFYQKCDRSQARKLVFARLSGLKRVDEKVKLASLGLQDQWPVLKTRDDRKTRLYRHQ
jgi:hypothetical protein